MQMHVTVCWDIRKANAIEFKGGGFRPESMAIFIADQLRHRLPGWLIQPCESDYEINLVWPLPAGIPWSNLQDSANSTILAKVKDIIEGHFQLPGGKIGRNIMGSIR